ncbi:CLAVATA3/ESR (CLE)-related protein 12-like [Melia azedarach]|uniref:CLAVATA3/ESR (CLE)-related protein 12-like n=1 Tax=Melia azedarach TaxID=155640 RepID=A0ACC1XPD5_MELAZ|nr:CLAVATA3/ESR (CLE)-related protein 12-like [Melia azedarach]
MKKIPQSSSSITIILCFSLFLLTFFHPWCNFTTLVFTSNTTTSSDNIDVKISNRKVLLMATKFDFSPFLHHRHPRKHLPQPAGTDVDPRYGAEKRLVPTGPNPLHH